MAASSRTRTPRAPPRPSAASAASACGGQRLARADLHVAAHERSCPRRRRCARRSPEAAHRHEGGHAEGDAGGEVGEMPARAPQLARRVPERPEHRGPLTLPSPPRGEGVPTPSPLWGEGGVRGDGESLVGDHAAVAQGDEAVGMRGEGGIVGHEHQGAAERAVEPHDQLDDLLAGGGVEIAGGLVGEEERRPARHRARHRHPLLLAAGELDRVVLRAVAEAQLGEEARGRARGRRARPPARAAPPRSPPR